MVSVALKHMGGRRMVMTIRPSVIVLSRGFSAPPNQPPPAPSPAELKKMIEKSEENVRIIREGTMRTVQPPMVAGVPDVPAYTPKDPSEIGVLSDHPEDQRQRRVIIRQKAQTAMQSAPAKTYPWTITWANQERWSNPLMGWTSTADPMSNMTMFFDTAEEAVNFAKRQGWPYDVDEPLDREHQLGTKKYAFNFLAEDVENRLKKEGVKTKEYKHEGFSASNWFQALKYHGDGEVEQHGPPKKK